MSAITLEQLKTRCRERADMVDSEFIEDPELTTYINASYTELYDLLTGTFEDYNVGEPVPFTIATGANTTTLPADFYKLRGVDLNLGGSEFATLRKFNFNQRHMASRPSRLRRVPNVAYRIVGDKLYIEPKDKAAGSYQLWYTPAATLMAEDADTMDGVNGWEEYVVVDVAIKMLSKEESPVDHLKDEKKALKERIENMAQNRDYDQPETITDIAAQECWNGFERF